MTPLLASFWVDCPRIILTKTHFLRNIFGILFDVIGKASRVAISIFPRAHQANFDNCNFLSHFQVLWYRIQTATIRIFDRLSRKYIGVWQNISLVFNCTRSIPKAKTSYQYEKVENFIVIHSFLCESHLTSGTNLPQSQGQNRTDLSDRVFSLGGLEKFWAAGILFSGEFDILKISQQT